MLDMINSSDDYVSTSSCSGRIALFQTDKLNKGGRWLLVEHQEVTAEMVIAGMIVIVFFMIVSFQFILFCLLLLI